MLTRRLVAPSMPVPNTGSDPGLSPAVWRVVFCLGVLLPGPTVVAAPDGAPPQRVVSLDLCTDWILARHADAAQVVAVSPIEPRYQPEGLRHQWPRHDGTLERVIELKPDLVITGQYNAITLRNRLKALGFRVEVLPLPTRLDEINAYERRALELLHKPLAQAHPGMAVAPPSTGPRLLLLGANGIGTGPKTLEHDILVAAGWQNYLHAPGYQQLDLERVVINPPDAVLWASTSGNALANRFSQHPALHQSLPRERWLSTDYWRWQCPGPWTWGLINELKAALPKPGRP